MRLINNFVVKAAYRLKFYIGISRGQIGWITGWAPEIASVGVIIYALTGWKPSLHQTFVFAPLFILFLAVTGYLLYKLGIWNTEVLVNVSKDPFQNEVYSAAKKINNSKIIINESRKV